MKALLTSLAGADVSFARLVSNDSDSIELIKQFVYDIDRPEQMKKDKYQGFLETQLIHIRSARAIEFRPSIGMSDDNTNEVVSSQPPASASSRNYPYDFEPPSCKSEPARLPTYQSQEKERIIPNLSAIVIKWADFKRSLGHTKSQIGRLKKEDLSYEIKWNEVWLEFDDPQYLFLFDQALLSRTAFSDSCANNTSCVQTKTFKGEGSAVSTASVTLENGFLRGTPRTAELKLPQEVAEAFTGFGHYLDISHRRGQMQMEKVVTPWSIDRSVTVQQHSEVKCSLIVTEVQSAASFKLRSRISGTVRVSVKHKSEVIHVFSEYISEICKRELEMRGKKYSDWSIEGGVVASEIVGKCSFKYVRDMKEQLTEKCLDEE